MSDVMVIYLGNPNASDDGAALRVADEIEESHGVRAGRPGAGLLDLMDEKKPTVLVDVTQSGVEPGTIHSLPLDKLVDAAMSQASVSSHGFGPSEALELGRALGRPLPNGRFVGLEGESFSPGQELSARVAAALPSFAAAIRAAIAELDAECTKAE